jgi:predicted phosphate transport protein (TIGR00153 family)
LKRYQEKTRLRKMARRIFGRFGRKRGENVLELTERHLELTQNAVISLQKMIETAGEKGQQEGSTIFPDISRFEREADRLRRTMVEELTKGEMYPEERDDLMELVRAVDWIADWSKEAGRILRTIPFEKAPDSIKKATYNMINANVDCVKVLIRSIDALPTQPSKALEFADEVEMLEETIDDLYGETRYQFVKEELLEFSIGELILMNEFFDAIETIADWCENTADIVRAIAVRRS